MKSRMNIEKQQNTFGWTLVELEKNSKYGHNANVLHEIAKECFNNEAICNLLVNNRYISAKTLALLAKHPCDEIRIGVARRSEEIPCYDNLNELTEKDFESFEDYEMAKMYNCVLVSLMLDKCTKVKEELSRTVKSEKIKMALYKGNQHNPIIIGNCVRRIKDMKFIRNFIIDAAISDSGKKLFSYAEDILLNKNLTGLELLTFIIYCPKLDEKHAQMISKSNGYNRLVDVLLKENMSKISE